LLSFQFNFKTIWYPVIQCDHYQQVPG